MGYFFSVNEEVEFKRLNGRLYLYVIHRGHYHEGMCPHAHVLDLSMVEFGTTDIDENNPASCRNLNVLCDKAKDRGEVVPYR